MPLRHMGVPLGNGGIAECDVRSEPSPEFGGPVLGRERAMNDWLDSWGSPDAVVISILKWVFGPCSVVVTAYLIITGLSGVRETGKSLLRGYRGARGQAVVLRDRAGSSVAGAVMVLVAVVVVQAVWVSVTYLFGVLIASSVGEGPKITAADLANPGTVGHLIAHATPIAAGVLAAAVVTILLAWKQSGGTDTNMDLAIFVFGALPCLFAIAGAAGAAIDAAVWMIGGKNSDSLANLPGVVIPLTGAAAFYAYYKACCVACLGPKAARKLRISMLTDGTLRT
jgi:hypothetical protein